MNTLSADDRLAPLDFSPLSHASHEIYRKNEPQDLRGPILLAALGLLLLDTLIVLYLGGGMARLAAAAFARRDRGCADPGGACAHACRAPAPKMR